MDNKLFIIGNGFDLHHQIPSSYWQFGEYLAQADTGVYETVKEYLNFDENFWNFFEERLATFDSDAVIDHAENFLVSYGAEDWSDAYHHNYEYEIEQIVSQLSGKLRACFGIWIRGLLIPSSNSPVKVKCIDPTAKFINFNYTPTLEKVYAVPDGNVLHIHGDSRQLDSQLILGHGWEPQANEKLSRFVDEDTDTRVAGGYELIDQYFLDTFKKTDRILAENSTFFVKLNTVNQVFVLGHSLADVDKPYISEIIKNLRDDACWTISFYGDVECIKTNFSRFGVPPDRVIYIELKNL